MKEIKKEVKSFKTVFQATDGTEFNDKTECEKYEKSARGVLMAKYQPIVTKTIYEEDLFGTGCENQYDIVKVSSQVDADIILQLALLENPYLTDEDHTDRLATCRKSIQKAMDEKDFLLIFRGFEMDGFAIEGTRAEMIERFNSNFE